MTEGKKWKFFGDKGCSSQPAEDILPAGGIDLVTRTRKNIKNAVMKSLDKTVPRKRATVETADDQLKKYISN